MSCTNTDSCNREECSYRIGLAIVLTIGLCLRIAYFAEQYRQPLFRVPLVDARYNDYLARGFAFGDWSLRGDETDYLDSPEVFVRARPFFRPPGYAFFLAILYKVTRGSVTVVLALQMALGVLNAWLAGVLARRLFGPRAAIFCAGLMATYWPFIYFETQLEEATFMTLLMLLLVRQIWLLARVTSLPNALTAGLQIGLLALTRPNAVLILPVIVAWLLWLGAKSCPFDVSVRASLALLGAAALAIAPVTIRNWLVGGEFVLISANTGVNFYIGNHEGATGFFVTDTPEFERFETSFDYPRV
ncbi:MAG: glycosyltransferase family 39 protein, partial [Kiritimatiellae bacterium]|nr:glycosyltransferase family 39 protein [Kiritimatiellia bacterium]